MISSKIFPIYSYLVVYKSFTLNKHLFAIHLQSGNAYIILYNLCMSLLAYLNICNLLNVKTIFSLCVALVEGAVIIDQIKNNK